MDQIESFSGGDPYMRDASGKLFVERGKTVMHSDDSTNQSTTIERVSDEREQWRAFPDFAILPIITAYLPCRRKV